MNTKYIIISLLSSFYFLSLQAQTSTIDQTQTISVTTAYVDNASMTWNVNSTVTNKPLLINYNIGTEYRFDFVKIYSIDSNGVENLLVSLSGIQSGIISSVIPTGKVKITFTSDGSVNYHIDPALCSGLNITFSTDNTYPSSTLANSYISGNSIVNGNLGIGVLNPSYKLEVNGTAKFSENIQCGYSISFADNARFTVPKTIIPDLKTPSFTMPQYGIGVPIAGGSADLWLSGNNSIRLFTAGNSTPRLTIDYSGNLGIGTTIPQTKLHVVNSISLGSVAGNYIALTRSENLVSNNFYVNDFTYRETNGTGWTSASYIRGVSIDVSFLDPKTTLRSWIKQNPYTEKIEFGSTGKTFMSIGNYVGIGTSNPDAMLTVKGSIHASEVLVDINVPADYVFKSGYKLMLLNDVEKYVKSNSHLPEIPSAEEIKKNGLNIGEMQNKLLQKIEELTLYVIDQQKTINQQSVKIEELERKMK